MKEFEKIKRIRKHHHYNTIGWLSDIYEKLILPTFKIKNMIKKETRVLNTSSVKNLLTFSHYEFRK